MHAILISLLAFRALITLLHALSANILVVGLLGMAYTAARLWLHARGYYCWERARSGAFADAIHNIYDVHFSDAALESLHALDPTKQYMFACGPHGPQCFSLVFGFAGYGSRFPAALGQRTRVAALHVHTLIPLVHELYSIFGVIDADRKPFEKTIRDGFSIALAPSGLLGKKRALLDPPDGNTYLYRRKQLGFLKLAAQYNIPVVPVLSADESQAYHMYNQATGIFAFVVMVGRYIILPLRPIRFEVGTPIPTANIDHNDAQQLHALADTYYAAMLALAKPHQRVRVRHAK